MKIKLLMAGLIGVISTAAFAQKSELNNAKNEYEKFAPLSANNTPAFVTVANTSLNNAKTAIDKAAANEKTATMPLTFALKGVIYAALAERDTVFATSAPTFAAAEDAIKKAKDADTKGENKKYIDDANTYLAQYKLTYGVKEYQSKQYEKAYADFDYYRNLRPDDTTAIYYTALAASNAGRNDPKYYQSAITNYTKLVTTKYSGNAEVYLNLSAMYLLTKDTVNALKVSSEGVAKFPGNSDIRKREIEIALQSGKQKDVLDKIQSAILNDPKNKTLYYYEGLTYSQVADEIQAKVAKSKDEAAKKTMHQTAVENYAKAEENYKKAVELDPDYFEANLNLGYVLMRPAIDLFNEARLIPANKQKDYDAARYKADALFEIAKPYLQKAVDLKPTSADALANLRNYYKGKYDPAKAKENSDKAAAIKKQIDAL